MRKIFNCLAVSLVTIIFPLNIYAQDDAWVECEDTCSHIHGIDISHYQGEVFWDHVGDTKMAYCYIKATEGGDRIDERYENNLKGLDKNNSELFYDAKNMMHSFRLATMAIEIAKGEGMKVNRTGIDADFLLDVRNRKYTYAELIDKLEVLKANMNEAFNTSTLPEEIDVEFVNDMLLSIRHSFTYESEHKAMD